MTVDESINRLSRRINRRGIVAPSANIYIEGIKAKLIQARFALDNLQTLEPLAEAIQIQDSTPSRQILTIDEKIEFYCEGFWDFLRSSLDIVGQLINTLHMSSLLNERQVDFKQIANKLRRLERGIPLQKAVDNCLRSTAFTNLEDYRHCSTHRRQVYIQTKIHTHTVSIVGTPGYYYGSSFTEQQTAERFLCSNPWGLSPIIDEERPVFRFCESLIRAIERRLITIINRLP